MSTPRVHWRPFRLEGPAAEPLLRVTRHATLDGQPIDSPLGRCVIREERQVLHVEVADGPFLGELVLRLAWYLVTARLGGVLIHAASIESSGRALVACGQSGAGKSTLSRLCREGGLRLLSDEVTQLFPDGRAGGTPFRSDADNAGSPGLVPARAFVVLRKAQAEALEPLSPTDAVHLALAQRFAVDAVALSPAEQRRRVLAFLGATSLKTLAFRKAPAVAAFVEALLAAP